MEQTLTIATPRPWGRWLLIATGVILTLLLLVVPLFAIIAGAFAAGVGGVIENLNEPDMLHAIGLTLFVAALTVPINLVFGTLLAWLVTRFEFRGRQLLLTLMDVPFAVSPVVAGLLYLLMYGVNGPVGGWLDSYDLQLMFSWPGIVMVTVFVTCPFM